MRILIASDEPIDDESSGSRTIALALGLSAAGHAVRVLDVGPAPIVSQRISLRRAVCAASDAAAELPFEAPHFGAARTGGKRYAELSDDELSQLRNTLRRMLDQEILDLDPQIIHAQRIWVMGHLALESGVPYAVTARQEEFVELERDNRYERLASEAAENAGRVIASSAELANTVRSYFGDLDERITVAETLLDSMIDATPECIAQLTGIYAAVLDERLGQRWRA
ncbi:MAG: glycosyltransferase [Singulisphaera sp.]